MIVIHQGRGGESTEMESKLHPKLPPAVLVSGHSLSLPNNGANGHKKASVAEKQRKVTRLFKKCRSLLVFSLRQELELCNVAV